MPLRKFKIRHLAVKPPSGGLTAKLALLAIWAICFWSFANLTQASTIDDLNKNIEKTKSLMKQNQEEIEKYQKEIENTGKETATLKSKIKNLEATGKKLAADIKLTQNQIQSAKLNIEKLNLQIGLKAEGIIEKKNSLGEFVRAINEAESANVLEIIISEDVFSDFFSNIDAMDNFQKEIKSNLIGLKEDKADLEEKKKEREVYKKNTEKLNGQYVDQKELVDINKTKTNKVLGETKNKEAVYKNLLADRIAKQKAFEDEIREFEDQIRLEIDPSALPKSGSGVLKWPLASVKITQYFGNTAYATANPIIYNGGGHPGVDFRASIGTRVMASKEGVVTGVGNTDQSCNGVSYGKWALIKHTNNLSTLYAHLSIIKVSGGQQVETGQLVGYSGDTGYADGPHLHFEVYASEGVEVKYYKSKICGTNMLRPMKIKNNALLNPLSYL
ncbi:MAG: hypothetical protein A2W59_02185 [Candidatus Terrybacteria bacterium RIFCSPHIGHO2_02_41_19]|uniref:M23ase beta-sheet core domain-containing protein n=1 Tax=Candidatus Terrybacteria bacterium RIFCSPHIGHO2_02_41_19 TaxID=1802364 RepID=A0A1G2PMY0_9BACT|nr:MAG: hypothetical protein A2W59_02185 [Candidatus Terrybacteria bacterium RIFCSPHIGHO2_02_41_19]